MAGEAPPRPIVLRDIHLHSFRERRNVRVECYEVTRVLWRGFTQLPKTLRYFVFGGYANGVLVHAYALRPTPPHIEGQEFWRRRRDTLRRMWGLLWDTRSADVVATSAIDEALALETIRYERERSGRKTPLKLEIVAREIEKWSRRNPSEASERSLESSDKATG